VGAEEGEGKCPLPMHLITPTASDLQLGDIRVKKIQAYSFKFIMFMCLFMFWQENRKSDIILALLTGCQR